MTLPRSTRLMPPTILEAYVTSGIDFFGAITAALRRVSGDCVFRVIRPGLDSRN